MEKYLQSNLNIFGNGMIFIKTIYYPYYQLNNKDRFLQVKCDGTTLYWENGIAMNDYDGNEIPGHLDIDPDYLYEISEATGDEFTKQKSV